MELVLFPLQKTAYCSWEFRTVQPVFQSIANGYGLEAFRMEPYFHSTIHLNGVLLGHRGKNWSRIGSG